MKLQKIFIVLMVLLSLSLLSSVVLADQFEVISNPVSYDFAINPLPLSNTACYCAVTSIPVSILNTGSYSASFHLSSDDSQLSFKTNDVVIKPGEIRTVLAYRDNPCLTIFPSKKFTVFVRSSFGISKNVSSEWFFSDCDSTSFAFDKLIINSSICKPFNTTLYITNDGLLTQNYSITPLTGTVALSAGNVVLPPKKTASIVASYSPSCDVYGLFDLKYRITSSSGKSYLVQQKLNIPYTYNYSLTLNKSFSVCSKDISEISFVLRNENNFNDSFDLELNSYFANFANNSKELTVDLQPDESKLITVFLDPSNNYLGDNTLRIDAEDHYGHLKKSVSTSIVVNNCYDVTSAFWLPKNKYVCGGDHLNTSVTLINNGIKDSPVALMLKGPGYVSFSKSQVIVPSNESVVVNLNFNIPKNITWGSYPYSLSIYSRGVLIGQKDFTLQTQPLSFCYKPSLKPSTEDLLFDENNFSLSLENSGTRKARYLIDLSLKNFSTNDSGVSFSLLNDSVVLLPGKKQSLLVLADFNKTIGDEFNFSLALYELNSGNVYSFPLTVKVVDHSILSKWLTSVWNKLYYANPCVQLALLLVFLIVIFFLILVCRSYKKRFFKFRKGLFLSLLLILIISLSVIYLSVGFEKPYPDYNLTSNSTTHILMKENLAKTINLSNYFYDPDGNIVKFGVSSYNSSILSYNVSGSLLTFTPKKDFSGDTMIRLFATDSYNATAESRQIRVDILPVPNYTCYSFYLKYCYYFNWILFLLFSIVFFLTFSFKKKSKEYQRTLNEVIVVRSKGVNRIPSPLKKTKSETKISSKNSGSTPKKNKVRSENKLKKSSNNIKAEKSVKEPAEKPVIKSSGPSKSPKKSVSKKKSLKKQSTKSSKQQAVASESSDNNSGKDSASSTKNSKSSKSSSKN